MVSCSVEKVGVSYINIVHAICINNEGHILLIAKQSLLGEPTWMFPGGELLPGESPKDVLQYNLNKGFFGGVFVQKDVFSPIVLKYEAVHSNLSTRNYMCQVHCIGGTDMSVFGRILTFCWMSPQQASEMFVDSMFRDKMNISNGLYPVLMEVQKILRWLMRNGKGTSFVL
jgi:hypothetical protein